MIIQNIKNMFKTNKGFMLLIVTIQAVCIFSILFSVGTMRNNYLFFQEDPYTTLEIYVSLNDVTYSEIEDTVLTLSEKALKNNLKECGVMCFEPNEKGGITAYYSMFGIRNNCYTICDTLTDTIQTQLKSGRIFSDEEIASADPKAIVYAYNSNELRWNEIDFEIIGVRGQYSDADFKMDSDHPIILLAPAHMKNQNINSFEFFLKRILTDSEKDLVTNAFSKCIPGRFEISFGKLSEGDRKATERTIKGISYLLAAISFGTLSFVYLYLFKKKRTEIAIWQLTGATRLKSIIVLSASISIIAFVSMSSGIILFFVLAKTLLVDVYKYINIVIFPATYASVFICLMLITIGMSIILAFFYSSTNINRVLKNYQ